MINEIKGGGVESLGCWKSKEVGEFEEQET